MNFLIFFILFVSFHENSPKSIKPIAKIHQAHEPGEIELNFESKYFNSSKIADEEHSTEFWKLKARIAVEKRVGRKFNTNKAKNIILFVGDGMSVPTLAATRVNLGNENQYLSFENFPDLGMAKTYCVNSQVSDSSCTATAYLTGIKGTARTAGLNAKVKLSSCNQSLDTSTHSYSIAKWAMDSGKSAGFVTTTRVTHASPSGVYAQIADRVWENDIEIKANCPINNLTDVAYQLVHGDVGKRLKVIMGGGRREFLSVNYADESGKTGKRGDGRNLINEWKKQTNGDYIYNRQQLLNLNVSKTEYLLGLFSYSHFPYHIEQLKNKLPTLAEMTEKAIDVLSKNEEGFFLFVEGGLIDSAHHDNYARAALDETAELSEAVYKARTKLSEDDTLIVVTSDHSHTMQYSGYASRGNDIFGIGGVGMDTNRETGEQIPFMTLSYGAGKEISKHNSNGTRLDSTKMTDNLDYNFRHPVTVPHFAETHGGDDVVVFASGPWSHLFTGTYEQNVIPHLMGYAACIGDGLKQTQCEKEKREL